MFYVLLALAPWPWFADPCPRLPAGLALLVVFLNAAAREILLKHSSYLVTSLL